MTKICTDINQSKILAEILPKESADMTWVSLFDLDHTTPKHSLSLTPYSLYSGVGVPAWNLAALLEQIPSDLGSSTLTIEKCDSEPFKYGLNYHDRWGREDDIQTKYYDDLVDACYEMILKLNELKLL